MLVAVFTGVHHGNLFLAVGHVIREDVQYNDGRK